MPIFEDNRTPEEKEERRRLLALPFRMVIEDVFDVKGRGVVVVGRIETGILREGDATIISGEGETLHTLARQLEMRGRIENEPMERWAGDTVGIFLSKDITKEQVARGMIVTKQGE